MLTIDDKQKAIELLQLQQGIAKYTITSVSGGKTSAYMAIHYPTDYYIFACVLTEDPNCHIKDKGLLRQIQNKLPQFEGSRELDLTLINVLRLEQELGQEIIWVAGDNYDEIIRHKKALPNNRQRFCTELTKIKPIFEWCYMNLLEPTFHRVTGSIKSYLPVEMNIGFRADEFKRVFKALNVNWNSDIKQYNWSESGSCERWKQPLSCDIQGQFKDRHRYVDFDEWRVRQFPLFEDNVYKEDVVKYWIKKGWKFPDISNCDYCFFHTKHEIEKQLLNHPERFNWWCDKEKENGYTFKNKQNYLSFINTDNNVEEEFDCNCTD